MSRTPFVATNWKMNHTRAMARAWCATFRELHAAHPWPAEVEVGVAPPFTTLEALHDALGKLPVLLGAQNVHHEAKGAFTGEIAPDMLVEAGCAFVILGHSERRHLFGEPDERIARKVAAVHQAGMTPLLCVGETEHQRDEGRMESVVEGQLRKGLEHFRPRTAQDLVLAYEPVWAIGTGRTASPAQAQEAQRFLRDTLAALVGAPLAQGVRILYGGSVTPANAATLAEQPDVDGFLVGGAGLDAGGFHKIVLAAAP
jgi:triosephosphate isomerase